MLNSDIHSCSFIIIDGILQRLKQVPTFQSVKRWSTTPMARLQVIQQADQLPYVGCYLLEETMGPDGDPNHAEPRFTHNVRIGFSVVIACNDEETATKNLDSAHWTILRLLENERWHKFDASGNFVNNPYTNKPNPIRIESITRGSRKNRYGNSSNTNETPVAELEMDLTITHRTYFPPIIPDMLDRIHVTVAYPWPYDPNLEEPFTVVYDLPIIGEFTINDYTTLGPSFPKPTLTVS